MRHPYPFEAIIFDQDGTLIDTESHDFRSCETLFAEHGLPLALAYWADLIVGRLDGYEHLLADLIHRTNKGLTHDLLWERLRALWRENLDKIGLMPGVPALLEALSQTGLPLAVATASDRKWSSRWLNQFGLWSYFRVVATRDDVIDSKPAPDVYLFAAEQLGVRPERCLVFEDSLAGLQAAKAAGMVVAAVPNTVTKTLDFSQADYLIDSLTHVNWELIQSWT